MNERMKLIHHIVETYDLRKVYGKKFLFGDRRSGKTTKALMHCILKCVEDDTKPNHLIVFVSPTHIEAEGVGYKIKDLARRIKIEYKELGREITLLEYDGRDLEIHTIVGSQLSINGMENIDWIVLDGLYAPSVLSAFHKVLETPFKWIATGNSFDGEHT